MIGSTYAPVYGPAEILATMAVIVVPLVLGLIAWALIRRRVK